VAAGNPPTTPEGLWVLKRWAAWLDPNHPNPAKPGELRWYTTGEEGKEIEVDGPGPHIINGEEITARSRTFIPAKLSDNPDLAATGYAATLAALPKSCAPPIATASSMRPEGRRLPVHPDKLGPGRTGALDAAPPDGVPMCSIGVDVAQGGRDNTVLAARHDGWYAPLVVVPGKETPDGASVAGLVVSKRRDNATIVLDMGGGYGGAAYEWLTNNGTEVKAYKGSEAGLGRTAEGKLKFFNVARGPTGASVRRSTPASRRARRSRCLRDLSWWRT
jgi:hypothetical protein